MAVLGAAILLGALATHWAWQRIPLAESGATHLGAADLAPLPPSVSGMVPATATPRVVRWRLTAADVLGEPATTRSRLRVVSGAPSPLASPPDGLVVVLAEAVRTGGLAGDQPVARLAGADAATGRIHWRGAILGDVADCVRAPEGVACLERFEHAGLLLLLDVRDGSTRWRADVGGRPSALSAEPAGFVTVAATAAGGGTDVELTRWDTDGSPRWSRAYAAPAGVTPGRPIVLGGAIVVEQVTIDDTALIVDAKDGALTRSRPRGAAVGLAHGRPLFDTGGENLAAPTRSPADGSELRGTPVDVVAADGSVALPTLTRRYGSADGRADLSATPAPGPSGRAWSLPGAHPLAACDGQLVLAVTEGRSLTLRAVVPATGATRWETPLRGTTPRSAACTPRTVLIPGGPTPAAVDEYDLATGAPGGPASRDERRPVPAESGSIDVVAEEDGLLTVGADSSGAWLALLS